MAVVRPGSGADAMRACVRVRAGSKPAREPSRAMGQAGSARDGEPRFRARDPHVRRRPIVARHEGVRTQRPVRAALTGFFSPAVSCVMLVLASCHVIMSLDIYVRKIDQRSTCLKHGRS